jgi:hypothetical protein
MPEFGIEQPVSEKSVDHRPLDVLAAGKVTEIFAEFCSAPVDGFHCYRLGWSWDLPANIASDLYSAT